MNRKKYMEEESECIHGILMSYLNKRKGNKIFLFFEGNDDSKYYIQRIAMYIKEREVVKYICECKKNVLKIYQLITEKTLKKNDSKCLYFIDKDFDLNENISNDIFITPSYSIENFYFSNNAIKNILLNELNLSEQKEEDLKDLDKVFSYLKDERDNIIEEIIYANAWYSLQIKKDRESIKKTNLSKIKEYKIIKNKCSIEDLENIVSDSIQVSDDEIKTEIENLRKDPIKRIRGKYFVQTMPSFFNKIFESATAKNYEDFFSKRRKVSIRVSFKNIISELSQYADTPKELISYIEEKLK